MFNSLIDPGLFGDNESNVIPTNDGSNDNVSHESETNTCEPDSETTTNTETCTSDMNGSGRVELNRGLLTRLPFVDWPETVRQRMLYLMLVNEDQVIIPTYYQGCIEGSVAETENKNYDIPMLLATAGNRPLYEEALTVFYGENIWGFRNPRIARWWLEKLGAKVALLRHVEIELTPGVWGPGHTRLEKLWLLLLQWMKPRVMLDSMVVSFEKWNNDPFQDYEPCIDQSRLGVFRTLLTFRGLKQADVFPGKYVPIEYTCALESSMVLQAGQVDELAEELSRELHEERSY